MMKIVEKMKEYLPVSRHMFYEQYILQNKEIMDILSSLSQKQKEIIEIQEDIIKRVDSNSVNELERAEALKKDILHCIEYSQKLEKIMCENHEKDNRFFDFQNNILKQAINLIRSNKRFSEEAVWANIFHDATNNTMWMNEKNYNPGRWAIGYQTLYVLYRILNDMKPRSILELGLGQSTKMISQYVEKSDAVCHKVVEHDEKWVEIYKKSHFLSEKTEVILKKLGTGELNGVSQIRTYADFSEGVMPQTYDLIVIDAPWGGDMSDYSRIDVAKIMPSCLEKSFIILLDDYNRKGEQNTLEYMKTILDKQGVKYSFAKYEGAKDLAVLASEDLEWSCTL